MFSNIERNLNVGLNNKIPKKTSLIYEINVSVLKNICTIYSCDVILAKSHKSKAFASCLFEWQFNEVNLMLHVKN